MGKRIRAYIKRFCYRAHCWFNGSAASLAKREDVTSGPRSSQGSTCPDEIGDLDEYKQIAGIIEEIILGNKINVYHESKSFSTGRLIAGEFERLGYPVEFIGKIVIANVKGKKLLFLETETSSTSLVGYRVLKNKNLARKFFEKAGISVARGKTFSRDEMVQAKKFALSLTSAVVKPVDGNKGKGVSVGVKSMQAFVNAWGSAAKVSKRVLIEEQFIGGVEARYLVIDHRCVAVFKKIPPYVVGNGTDPVSKLLKQKNEVRADNPYLRRKLIKLNEHRLLIMKQQGYELSSVPPKGAIVILDWKASISSGGDSVDITDEAHPSLKHVAESVAGAVSGLDIVGVDILAYDHSQEAQEKSHIVIEANTRPCLGSHHYPVYGMSRNVAKVIVDYTLNKNRSN